MAKIHIGFISTYIPRQCGIATFTNDILRQIAINNKINLNDSNELIVCAITNNHNDLNYPPEVKFEIHQQQKKDYINAAHFLNNSQADIINIQHEFGIFGGDDGVFILDIVNNLKKPIVVTLHTVIEKPTQNQKNIIKNLAKHSTYIIVLAQKAVDLLNRIYSIPLNKIKLIHHGAPDVPFVDSSYYKSDLNIIGKKVILTFGLINPNKGIEYGIEAMAKIVKKYPETLYMILGRTHPEVIRIYSEEYRISLQQLVKKYNLSKNIEFYNYYVSKKDLIKFLLASDIYLTPYLSKEQIVSGTLAYALASGKALISTPYWYAEELLKQDRGIIVPFKNSNAIADAAISLFSDNEKFNRIRKNAYDYGRQFIWKIISKEYENIFEKSIKNYTKDKKIKIRTKPQKSILPEISLKHLDALTDDTGILQHSIFTVPNKIHGYSTDDNARALIVAIKHWHLTKDELSLLRISKYLSFVNYAINSNKEIIHNFMKYNREWADKKISEDTAGRTIWALAYTLKHAPNESIHILAMNLFKKTILHINHFTSPRAWAFIIIGSILYLSVYPGDLEIKNICSTLIKRLISQYNTNKSSNWKWPEDIVSYENARIPQAILSYGGFFGNRKIFAIGQEIFQWLIDIQMDTKNKRFSLIGNKGWYKRNKIKASFDQQPVEIAAIIDASYEAYKYTKKHYFVELIELGIEWFLGNNDVGERLYDFISGGSRDGIHSTGVNLNEGAESTLSWLLSIHRLYEVQQLSTKKGEKYAFRKRT